MRDVLLAAALRTDHAARPALPAARARAALVDALPERARRCIVLDDAALGEELVRLTDWHVDRLFSWVPDHGGRMFAATLSRLAFDSERFLDDAKEPMAKIGQSVVYTGTTQLGKLAEVSAEERAWHVAHWYVPYHQALEEAVASLLEQFGRALILDCHSFATEPLATEPDQRPGRPDICLGTDAVHTPRELADPLHEALEAEGFTVRRNSPFSGTLVPLRYLGSDRRVASVMIEVQRGLYRDEQTGAPTAGFDSVRAALERGVGVVIDACST